tara:strand:+ start:256 stop:453 length:198 start_codon:yes stop_codon:yes gene_type:complete
MPRKKKVLSKREKVFNFVSKVIDLVQDKWRTYIKATIFLAGVSLFVYILFWIDTVAEIKFEIIYM